MFSSPNGTKDSIKGIYSGLAKGKINVNGRVAKYLAKVPKIAPMEQLATHKVCGSLYCLPTALEL